MKASKTPNTKREIFNRAKLIFGLIAAFAIYLVITIFSLQHGYDSEFSLENQKKNTRVSKQEGIRGNIYASDGSLLATSVPTYDLYWDVNVTALGDIDFNKNLDTIALLFSQNFTEKTFEEWKEKILYLRKANNHYFKVTTDLSFDKVREIFKWPIVKLGRFSGGFWVEERAKRMYFMGSLAKRAIGYSKGKYNVGLEGSFDSLLRGKSIEIMEQRMPGNIWRPVKIGAGQTAENGKDIVTTLEVRFQDIAQHALNKSLIEHDADHGCAMVMEVSTGAIKAMANLKKGQDGKYYESMNYAVDQFSEPGSTMKILSALALLEENEVGLKDSIETFGGKVQIYDRQFSDETHGSNETPKKYSLEECIAYSSNVGITQLVNDHFGNNPETYIKYIHKAGLHVKPDFDIPSSNYPKIIAPGNSLWTVVTLPSMSIGYSLQISPLQTLMLYNAIANKGLMMKPFMVKEIRKDGKVLETINPSIYQKTIANEKTCKSLNQFLEAVTEKGTAKSVFKDCKFPVAGKTGTARISQSSSGYSGNYLASFAGYFPSDQPVYSIVVVINSPKKGGISGASVAAPVFKEIADKIYSTHLQIQPELLTGKRKDIPKVLNGNRESILELNREFNIPVIDKSDKNKWINTKEKSRNIIISPKKIQPNKIPDFRGLGIKDAFELARELKLELHFNGYGRIVTQNIKPGTRFRDGRSIFVELKP